MAFTYILRCRDGSYYVGSTHELAQRLAKHHDGTAATYTASRRPVSLVYAEEWETSVAASARERQIKRWTRVKKEALIAGATIRLSES